MTHDALTSAAATPEQAENPLPICAPPADAVPVSVPLAGPLDVATSLDMFRRNGDDLLDRWDGETLVRTLPGGIPYVCVPLGSIGAPQMAVYTAPEHRETVLQVVPQMLVDAPVALAELLDRDPVIARLERRFPGVRQVRQFDLFAALVRCISAQQVNLRWAATTRRRLAEAFGDRHLIAGNEVYSLDAVRLAAANPAEIRALQFTTRKAEYIVAAAEACASGTLTSTRLAQLPDEEVIAAISRVRGLGRWSAEWVLARVLGRPRVVAGDLGVRKAVGLAYLGTPTPSEAAVREVTASWGAAASVAQALLLHELAVGPEQVGA